MLRLPPGAEEGRALPAHYASLETGTLTIPSTDIFPGEEHSFAGQTSSAGGPSAFCNGLRRHRFLAFIAGVVCCAAAGAAAWYNIEPKYTAFALLRLARHEPRLVFSTGDVTENPEAEYEDYKRAQQDLVTSRLVLQAALQDPRLSNSPLLTQEDPVGDLGGAVGVDFSVGKNVMRIWMKGSDPAAIAETVNAVSDAYIQEAGDNEHSRRLERLAKLEKIYNETDHKVRGQQAELRKLAESLGTGDKDTLAIKQQNALQHSAALRTEYARIQSQLMQIQGEVASKESILAKKEPEFLDESADEYVDALPEIAEQRKEVTKIEMALNDALLVANDTADHPLLARLRRELSSAEKSLEAKRIALRPKARERLRQKEHAKAATELVSLRVQLSTLTASEQRLRSEVDRFYREAEELGKSSIDVEAKRSEIAHVEKVADNLGSEIETLRVELRSPPRVVLMQSAEVPRSRDTRLRLSGTGFASLMGFILPVVAICWWDSRAQRVNSAREVSRSVGLRVIGSVPRVSRRERKSLIRQTPSRSARQSVLRESLDTIRTVLLNGVGFEQVRVVLITSAMEGEGKTTTATQLAVSFARGGRKTLLLDFDLRQPEVHRVLGMSNSHGLSELLRGEVGLEEIVRPTNIGNLWMVSAGRCDDAAICNLSQRQSLKRHFEQLRAEYDFVIVDCSPVLPVVDCMLVAQNVDAVVLSVLRDVSRVPAVYAARQRLSSLGIRVLGAVVTGAAWDAYYSESYQSLNA